MLDLQFMSELLVGELLSVLLYISAMLIRHGRDTTAAMLPRVFFIFSMIASATTVGMIVWDALDIDLHTILPRHTNTSDLT